MSDNIIRDVITRTSGELFLGVVGSVRSGKSTFIRRFMELKVLPYVQDKDLYKRILDELPQSSEGRAIMTVEPKFVPSEQMKVTIENDISFNARLVDCVGYVIPSATGYLNDDGTSRMVQTPWYSEDIPFNEAASLGTKKVIESHANIGIVITSDGSFGEFKRHEYEVVEEKIIDELKALNKPFIIVVNTIKPNSEETINLVNELKDKYDNAVVAVDVKNMTETDADKILKEVLNEFDIDELSVHVPSYIDVLDDDVSYKQKFNTLINDTTANYRKLKDVFKIQDTLKNSELFENVEISNLDPSTGHVEINITCSEELFKSLIEEVIGETIDNKGNFMKLLQNYKKAVSVYQKLGNSLDIVKERGYDIAVPKINEMTLDKPELIKQGTRYGIKIKAIAPAICLTEVNIESTFEPIIGSEAQAEALINHMLEKSENNIEELWNSEIFGRKLCDVINDGIYSKTSSLSDETLIKFKEGLEKVVNHGHGGVIALII
ncbi:MAG: stage IV sporulation protein A [Bacilli bacterium]|nr:stage IV sporulation protein A [Bacilli bacterium]